MADFFFPLFLWALALVFGVAAWHYANVNPPVAVAFFLAAMLLAATGTVLFGWRFKYWRDELRAETQAAVQRAQVAGRIELYAMQLELLHYARNLVRFLVDAGQRDPTVAQFMAIFTAASRQILVGGEPGTAGLVTVRGYRDADGIELRAGFVIKAVQDGPDDLHMAAKRRYRAAPEAMAQWELAYKFLVVRGYVFPRPENRQANVAPAFTPGFTRRTVLRMVARELYPQLRDLEVET